MRGSGVNRYGYYCKNETQPVPFRVRYVGAFVTLSSHLIAIQKKDRKSGQGEKVCETLDFLTIEKENKSDGYYFTREGRDREIEFFVHLLFVLRTQTFLFSAIGDIR